MFSIEERDLRTAFEEVASDMYGGDATEFFGWTDEYGGEYIHQDVNSAFRAFIEGVRLGQTGSLKDGGLFKSDTRTDFRGCFVERKTRDD